jgi:hypothetical protein
MKYGYYDLKEYPSPIKDYTDGAHIIVLRKVTDFVENTCILEDTGWSVRDSIKVITETESFNATLFRKPFKGTVANNVLKNGCGGINIDATRIEHQDPDIIRKTFESPLGMEHCARNRKGERGAGPSPDGRFPANLILIHSNCKNNCNEGCPVIKLDLQSGNRKGWHSQNHNNFNMYGGNSLLESKTTRNGFHEGYNDSGGASRFFKQFHSLEEVKEYLTTLICC